MKRNPTELFTQLPKSLCVVAAYILGTSGAHGALSWVKTTTNPSMDGTFASGEWNQASFEPAQGGLGGGLYAMAKQDYIIGAGNYVGTVQFLAHNIELLAGAPDDADFNVFDFYKTSQRTPNPLLTVWVFNDTNSTNDNWLNIAGIPGYSGSSTDIFDDRGFYVYNHDLGMAKHWLPGQTRPEDGGYDWSETWGIYARGGHDNSAFTSGLSGANNNANPLFETTYFRPAITDPGTGLVTYPELISVFRSIHDPDFFNPNDPGTGLITYWEGVVTVIPEPASALSTVILLSGGLLVRRRKQLA